MLTSLTYYLDLTGRRGTRPGARLETGAVGVRLICVLQEDNTNLDISAATTMNICLRAPSGGDKVLSAAFQTDGTDGAIYADTVLATLDEIGTWKISAQVIGPTYARKSPSFGTFQVTAPICP
ncbi:hypothetical protein OAF54_03510 [bacterium]|nr:hypothetical protein [bacterium]